MELHHHPNLNLGFKGWKSFMWEFLMLFLAVFAASLAEYQLEHKIERDREKQYIQSMIIDLSADTTNLATAIHRLNTVGQKQDSVLIMFNQLSVGFNDTLINNLFHSLAYVSFTNNDRTMQQLKNSGAMRLISKQSAANAIMDYDSKIRNLENVTLPILQDIVLHNLLPLFHQLINIQEINYDFNHKSYAQLKKENKTYLLRNDKAKLGEFYNSMFSFRSTCIATKEDEIKLKKQASKLIKLLKTEYKLE